MTQALRDMNIAISVSLSYETSSEKLKLAFNEWNFQMTKSHMWHCRQFLFHDNKVQSKDICVYIYTGVYALGLLIFNTCVSLIIISYIIESRVKVL